MAAYEVLLDIVKTYFVDIGYNAYYVERLFSNANFKEILSIKLANANVVIKNKTDRNSHQTHIAITGEAIGFFYNPETFNNMQNDIVDNVPIKIFEDNLIHLETKKMVSVDTAASPVILDGTVTIGKRTQKQVQLSKKNRDNSECFNRLRSCLYENDLLILLKERTDNSVFTIGIPRIYYESIIEDYSSHYDTNTYLRIPRTPNGRE